MMSYTQLEFLYKECSYCKQLKHLNEFYFRKKENKYTSQCKKCQYEIKKTGKVSERTLFQRAQKELSKTGKRKCNKCNKIYPLDEIKKIHEYYSNICYSCSNLRAKNYNKNPKKSESRRVNQAERTKKSPEKAVMIRTRTRARKIKVPFNLDESDIVIPEYCPILGIRLFFGEQNGHSPSVDRIDNSKGYVKGNIKIISHRANTIKNNGTIEEHEKIIKYMKENGCN